MIATHVFFHLRDMNKNLISLITLALAIFSCNPAPKKIAEEGFEFVVLGDTWYWADQKKDYFELIDLINEENPAFTIHVGDFRGGPSTPCDDIHFDVIYNSFMQFNHPLFYTPGDNEWTDCWLENDIYPQRGGFNPEDRLDAIRERFFKEAKSLGKNQWPVKRQSDETPEFSKFSENTRWWHEDILFFTAHIVGSNNGYIEGSEDLNSEYQQRNNANLKWIKQNFDIAKENDAKAIVFAYHAEIDPDSTEIRETITSKPGRATRCKYGEYDGFKEVRELIKVASIQADCPVLQVYGDAHRFTFKQPYEEIKSKGEEKMDLADHVLRLQTYGSPHMRAVKVKVVPDKPWFFEVVPLFVH